MQEAITIRGRWTVETLGASLLDLHRVDKKIKKWQIVVYVLLMATSLVFIFWAIFGPKASLWNTLSSLGILAFVMLGNWSSLETLFWPAQAFKRQAKKMLAQPTASEETTFFFTDEFTAQIDSLSEVRLKWANFSKYQLLDYGLVLFMDGPRNIVIPRAWAPDESTWQAILTLVADKVPATSPSK